MIKKLILTIMYLCIFSCSSWDSNSPTAVTDDNSTTILGCMDSNASNFNTNAMLDDDSCTYIGSGNHPINSLWFIPNSDGTWGIGYNSDIQIGGFQITINGSTIITLINGDAQENGFTVSSGNTGIILGFSFSGAIIPVGSGILFSLELDTTPISISDIIIADEFGISTPFTFEATYFLTNLEMTGNTQLTILSSTITTLDIGDEIGVFDTHGILNYNECTNQIGEILVGSGIWKGEQLEIVNIGSVDMCSFGGVQVAGYVESNPIIIKIWDVSEQKLKIGFPEYSLGNGFFSDILVSISQLSF